MFCRWPENEPFKLQAFGWENLWFCWQDAAANCISVEFVFLEQNSSHLADIPESINKFLKQIGDLDNCSFQNYIPGYGYSLILPYRDL